MYNLMNQHYNDLKVRLGVVGEKEDPDAILKDPIPFNEMFPKVVVNQIEEDKKHEEQK